MSTRRRVVITGLGAITSLGMEINELWNNVLAQKSGISKIEKFDASNHTVQIAGEIKNFSPVSLTSKNKRRWDLFTQYAVEAAHQAIEDGGIDFSQEDITKFGVILGSGMGGMTEVEAQQDTIREKGPRGVSPYLIPKVMVSAPSAEISIKYGLRGPNFSTSAACSSSGYAIGMALKMIQYEEADVIITGGTEAIITPLTIAGFSSARALSTRNNTPEKASRPFEKDRDGFVMGEGAGILILEELERAKKRGARIYAELCGAAWGADAHHITEPAPEGRGAVSVMEKALSDAQINKGNVSYINAHGTSTLKNDSAETQAIKKVFGEKAYQIPVSSTKSMIGHLIGASGAVEGVVTALSIANGAIHATANYETPDPLCDLDYVGNGAREIALQYAISNSFAFGGANACLVFGKHS